MTKLNIPADDPEVVDILIIGGNTYQLTVRSDDLVRLNIDITNREREALRDFAERTGSTMRDVVRDALNLVIGS